MLHEKVIIVTGAASGIGLAAAHVFASYKARLVLADLDGERLEAAADAVVKHGGDAIAITTDVTDEDQVEKLVRGTFSHYRRLDGAFNNAGVETLGRPLHEIDAAGWRKVLAVDLEGVFLCIKHQVRALLASDEPGASIVNTASTLSMVAMRNGAEYVAAKHGVLGLTRSAAVDYAKNGIRVNAVLPGVIETPILKRMAKDPGVAAMMEGMRKAHPMGRFGRPEEVGEAAAWLLSDKSSFVTGSALAIDGGFLTL